MHAGIHLGQLQGEQGMTPEMRNALRCCAREALNEAKKAFAENPGVNKDKLSRPILLKHYERIKPLGISFVWLLYTIGVLNGVLEDRS